MVNLCRLTVERAISYIFTGPRSCKADFRWKAKSSNDGAAEKSKHKLDTIYIDKRGKFRSFNHKKVSRKRCNQNIALILLSLQYMLLHTSCSKMRTIFCIGGSLRSRGWKYGSGFVDGIFPVMSPAAEQILDIVQNEADRIKIWEVLDTLPASHIIWDDIINVAVQLRLNKMWDSIILVRN